MGTDATRVAADINETQSRDVEITLQEEEDDLLPANINSGRYM